MSFLLPSHQSRKVLTSSINKKKETTRKIKQCLCLILGLAIGILIWLFYQTIQVATTMTTTKRITQVSGSFKDNLLAVKSNGADLIWEQLLKEASDYLKQQDTHSSNQQIGVAMEVGMHRAVQCIMAANAGLEVHCVEPSPKSFQRVQKEVQHDVVSDKIRSKIHLYQRAASDISGIKVPFSGSGGTGDFVGDGGYDIWTMTKKESTQKGTIGLHQVALETVEVETIALDDIIESLQPPHVYLLKVDVQGFEPNVMRGLQKSIANHRIQFLLFEYWPKGIEFMHDEPLGSCTLPTQMLHTLVEHGYTLYATNVVAHPKCPKGSRMGRMWKVKRPLDNIMKNCLWYHQHELEFLSEDYKMGYWTDVLAVAPGAILPNMIQPTTLIGQALKSDLIS